MEYVEEIIVPSLNVEMDVKNNINEENRKQSGKQGKDEGGEEKEFYLPEEFKRKGYVEAVWFLIESVRSLFKMVKRDKEGYLSVKWVKENGVFKPKVLFDEDGKEGKNKEKIVFYLFLCKEALHRIQAEWEKRRLELENNCIGEYKRNFSSEERLRWRGCKECYYRVLGEEVLPVCVDCGIKEMLAFLYLLHEKSLYFKYLVEDRLFIDEVEEINLFKIIQRSFEKYRVFIALDKNKEKTLWERFWDFCKRHEGWRDGRISFSEWLFMLENNIYSIWNGVSYFPYLKTWVYALSKRKLKRERKRMTITIPLSQILESGDKKADAGSNRRRITKKVKERYVGEESTAEKKGNTERVMDREEGRRNRIQIRRGDERKGKESGIGKEKKRNSFAFAKGSVGNLDVRVWDSAVCWENGRGSDNDEGKEKGEIFTHRVLSMNKGYAERFLSEFTLRACFDGCYSSEKTNFNFYEGGKEFYCLSKKARKEQEEEKKKRLEEGKMISSLTDEDAVLLWEETVQEIVFWTKGVKSESSFIETLKKRIDEISEECISSGKKLIDIVRKSVTEGVLEKENIYFLLNFCLNEKEEYVLRHFFGIGEEVGVGDVKRKVGKRAGRFPFLAGKTKEEREKLKSIKGSALRKLREVLKGNQSFVLKTIKAFYRRVILEKVVFDLTLHSKNENDKDIRTVFFKIFQTGVNSKSKRKKIKISLKKKASQKKCEGENKNKEGNKKGEGTTVEFSSLLFQNTQKIDQGVIQLSIFSS